MATFWNDADRTALLARARQLNPAHTRQWGKMDAAQMFAHVHDAARMTLGELPCAPKKFPLAFTLLRPVLVPLIVHVFPFPKNAPTAPELIARRVDDWSGEWQAFEATVGRLVAWPSSKPWPAHPAFGVMSHHSWGTLIHRHMDHHLRQFGL